MLAVHPRKSPRIRYLDRGFEHQVKRRVCDLPEKETARLPQDDTELCRKASVFLRSTRAPEPLCYEPF
jgi:hypothetical protein